MTFIPDSTLQTAVAAAISKTWATDLALTTYWPTIVTNANLQAYGDIVSRLAMRGYDPVLQIPFWDRGIEFNTSLGVFWALTNASQLNALDRKAIDVLDRRGELDLGFDAKRPPLLITVNGMPIFPTNPIVMGIGPMEGVNPQTGLPSAYNPSHWKTGPCGPCEGRNP